MRLCLNVPGAEQSVLDKRDLPVPDKRDLPLTARVPNDYIYSTYINPE